MNLREYLFRQMVTHAEFAEKLGCTRNYITMICNARAYPSRPLAKLIYNETNGLVKFDDPEEARRTLDARRKKS